MNLAERFRPKTWDEVVGQDAAVSRLRAEYKGGRRCFWLSGSTGCGKTTCAKILAAEHCPRGATVEYNSAGLVKVDDLDAIQDALNFRPIWGGLERRAWIINESQNLHAAARDRLLGLLESVEADEEARVLVIFTTMETDDGDLFGGTVNGPAILHRCCRVKLTNQGLAQAGAERMRACMASINQDGHPVEWYVELMRAGGKNSIRAGWEELSKRLTAGGGA